MIRRARILLIQLAKSLPFILRIFVIVSYYETLYSIALNNFYYIESNKCLIPKKYLSWAIGNIFTYNVWTLLLALFLSICFETCLYNKLSIVYLASGLIQKQLLQSVEVTQVTAIAICIVNIALASYLVYKGCRNAICAKKS